MNWTAVEDAIYSWVSGASGVTTLWFGQNAPRPANGAPWISMRLRNIQPVGQDWVYYQDAGSPTAGAELTAKVQGTRRVTLELQCFGTTSLGSTGPVAILDNVLASRLSEDTSDALSAASVCVVLPGPVLSVDGIANIADFEPRAFVEIVLHVAGEYGSDTATYIGSVDLAGVMPVGDDDDDVTNVIVRLVEGE